MEVEHRQNYLYRNYTVRQTERQTKWRNRRKIDCLKDRRNGEIYGKYKVLRKDRQTFERQYKIDRQTGRQTDRQMEKMDKIEKIGYLTERVRRTEMET